MPAFLPGLLWMGGTALLGLGAHQAWNFWVQPWIDAAKLKEIQEANAENLFVLPGPEALIQLWHGGWLEQSAKDNYGAFGEQAPPATDILERLLRYHGIPTHAYAKGFLDHKVAWNAAVLAALPRLSVPELMVSYLKGEIGWDAYSKGMKKHGCNPDTWAPLLRASSTRFSNETIADLRRRGFVTTAQMIELLRHNGMINPDDVVNFARLLQFLPPPTDLIRFQVREFWSEDKEVTDALKAEYPAGGAMEAWFRASGIGKVKIYDEAAKQERELNSPLAYWMSHWDWPSPTQMYLMLHRLRPGRTAHFKVDGQEPKPVTGADVDRVLKINDMIPEFRTRLAAIAYALPTRVDIRRMFRAGLIKRDEVKEAYLDLGYTPNDAESLTKFTEWEAENAKKKKVGIPIGDATKRARKAALAAYAAGVVDDEALKRYLVDLGLDEASAAFEVGLAAYTRRLNRTKSLASWIRRQYLTGGLPEENLIEALSRAGWPLERAEAMAAEWRLEFTFSRKAASAAKIQKWYEMGLLTAAETKARLNRIGVRDPDDLLYITESTSRVAAARNRMMEQAAKGRAAAERAIMAKIRELESEKAKAVRALKSHGSPAQLKKWVKQGLMHPQEAIERLTIFGWPLADILRLLEEDKKDAKSKQQPGEEAGETKGGEEQEEGSPE